VKLPRSYSIHHVHVIEAMLAETGFRYPRIQKAKVDIRCATARRYAEGMVRGTPRGLLIEQRGVALGHPDDVRRFMQACGAGERRYTLLSREHGYRRDYGHIDMLTAPEAEDDHFPAIAGWIGQHERLAPA
jgi:hypothetical protein